jgi:hypothetical protein
MRGALIAAVVSEEMIVFAKDSFTDAGSRIVMQFFIVVAVLVWIIVFTCEAVVVPRLGRRAPLHRLATIILVRVGKITNDKCKF